MKVINIEANGATKDRTLQQFLSNIRSTDNFFSTSAHYQLSNTSILASNKCKLIIWLIGLLFLLFTTLQIEQIFECTKKYEQLEFSNCLVSVASSFITACSFICARCRYFSAKPFNDKTMWRIICFATTCTRLCCKELCLPVYPQPDPTCYTSLYFSRQHWIVQSALTWVEKGQHLSKDK